MRRWIRDIREKTAGMGREKTAEYVMEYYWYHILIGFIALGLAALLVYHVGFGDRKKEFTCVLVNQEVDYERDERLAREFGEYSGIQEKEIWIDSDYQISYGGRQLESVKESSYEKFFFNWQAGEIDAMIMTESFYQYCLKQGGKFTEEKIPVKTTRLEGLVAEEEDDPVYLVFAADAKHKKACGLFQKYMCGEVEKE